MACRALTPSWFDLRELCPKVFHPGRRPKLVEAYYWPEAYWPRTLLLGRWFSCAGTLLADLLKVFRRSEAILPKKMAEGQHWPEIKWPRTNMLGRSSFLRGDSLDVLPKAYRRPEVILPKTNGRRSCLSGKSSRQGALF